MTDSFIVFEQEDQNEIYAINKKDIQDFSFFQRKDGDIDTFIIKIWFRDNHYHFFRGTIDEYNNENIIMEIAEFFFDTKPARIVFTKP